jgi:hypothetical protein
MPIRDVLRRRRLHITVGLGAIATLFLVALTWIATRSNRLPDDLRDRMVAFLSERLDSDVSLSRFEATLFPAATARGGDLVLHYRPAAQPLLTVRDFDINLEPRGFLQDPRLIEEVTLRDVTVHIPRRSAAGSHSTHPASWTTTSAVIKKLIAKNLHLEIGSKRPEKPPFQIDIHDITVRDAALERKMKFEALLTNPVPRGAIRTAGEFGPWVRDEPDRTPVRGSYELRDANLGEFAGLMGTLASRGEFKGVLERIEVRGTTKTPDFGLDYAGNRIPLNTRFEAVVDGTSGDTLLDRVETTIGRSVLVASGRVIRQQGVKGRLVSVHVDAPDARLEDLLRLAVKGKTPPMSGVARIHTRLLLPPGEASVIERLALEGTFRIASARFANFDVQRAVTELSRRGQGVVGTSGSTRPESRVMSNISGSFTLKNGRLDLRGLNFSVPGAVVRLSGVYGLRREDLAFTGEVLLDASVSQLTTGWKRWLLKPFNPWFRRKGAGTLLPIKVTGSRDKPSFGVDVKRALLRRD